MKPSFSVSDLKHYPHFDAPISISEINELVGDPNRVANHKFYPFLQYHDTWQPYRGSKDQHKPPKKSRPISYAARKDAYIFAYYRQILLEKYEQKLEHLGIQDCPIAYRKICKPNGQGKCNIDFAKDAFDFIQEAGDCTAIALDIKGYFNNLDHLQIKKIWCELLSVERLPADHYRVFKNITQYHYVDQEAAYRRLGFIHPEKRGYTLSYKNMPKQLCESQVFREKICGSSGKHSTLIKSNKDESGVKREYGIPQGAPLSDLIANFYLIYFDLKIKKYVSKLNGKYMRYSDDILLIIPNNKLELDSIIEYVRNEIEKNGEELKIKDAKTCVVEFNNGDKSLTYKHVKGPQGANGFEYLGFRFDGRKIYVRDSTFSRLYRKVSSATRWLARRIVDTHGITEIDKLMQHFDPSQISQRYMRVRSDILQSNDYNTWTFYSYLIRATEIFGNQGASILPQARRFKQIMYYKTKMALEKELQKRSRAEQRHTKSNKGT